jgi:hypothetical protein
LRSLQLRLVTQPVEEQALLRGEILALLQDEFRTANGQGALAAISPARDLAA